MSSGIQQRMGPLRVDSEDFLMQYPRWGTGRSGAPSPCETLITRQSYLTDVLLERVGPVIEGIPFPGVKDLCVLGIPGSDKGRTYPFVKASSGEWEISTGSIPLPPLGCGIDLIVRSEQGNDISFLRIDNARSLGFGRMGSDMRYRWGTITLGVETCFSISGEILEVTPARPVALDDIPRALNDDGIYMAKRFETTCNLEDLDRAISLQQGAIRITPEGHLDLSEFLNNLGTWFQYRFDHTRDLQDIDKSVAAHQKAMKLVSKGDALQPALLANLGDSLLSRMEETGDFHSIDEVVSSLQEAVLLTPPDHHALPTRLRRLGRSFQGRFEKRGALSDVDDAILARSKVARLTADGDENLPLILCELGSSLGSRFERLANLPDIDQAISALRRAVRECPSGHRTLPTLLNDLGASLQRRFQHTANLTDIAEATSSLQQAVKITPSGHGLLPMILTNLSTAYRTRFRSTGDVEDIIGSITASEIGLQLVPEGDPQLPVGLFSLASALLLRFDRMGQLQDVTEAATALQKAVRLTSEDDPTLPTMQSTLGTAFLYRYGRTGNISDLADAIAAQHRAVHLTPEGHTSFPIFLNNLGTTFQRRFERTGDLPDIIEAIATLRRAVGLTPSNHSFLPGRLMNLGSSLQRRFEKIGDLSDINEAISVRRKAVQLTPDGHPGLHTVLNLLGNSLQNRFDRTGNIKDVDEAISVKERSVELAPKDDPNLPAQLINLGVSLQSRFDVTGKLTDIQKAISVQQAALQLTPEGHPILPARLGLLGNSLYSKAISSGDSDDLKSSISHYRSSAKCRFGSPRDRLEGARRWVGRLYRHFPRSPELIDACEVAIGLVTLIAGLDETVQRRYTRILDVSGIAPDSAAIACALDRVDKALEWLEQGRCLVWGQLNHLRTPLDKLQVQDPALARRITDVSKKLETAGSARGQVQANMALSARISVEDDRRIHVKLANEWDDLLSTVRAIPGFDSFLRPPPCSNLLQNLPEGGSVVVINIDGIRCDAIALMAGLDEPMHIPLPNITLEVVIGYRRMLSSQLQSQGLRSREAEADIGGRALKPLRRNQTQDEAGGVRDVLQGLWTGVVKPILDMLAFSRINRESGDVPPRIWWCPTGPLSMLPIHAAGIYGDQDSECVMDYAISSYTPTVTSLTDRVGDSRPANPSVSGLFLTSQPNAPGASHIPGTTEEVGGIYTKARQIGERALRLIGDDVTVDQCLEHMENYSSVHLACHASQNPADPLQSKFLFHKGSLDLGTVFQRNLKDADFAFLSACQTSMGDEQLSNESVHLAAGMLAAGYRRVVATMWSIGDRHAIDVANDFYEYLWRESKGGMGRKGQRGSGFDGALSAYALHHAIQQLRGRLDNSSASLLAWVPYVHFGY